MSSQVCLNIGPRGASISLARPNKSPKKPITALIAAPTELAIAFHASVSAFPILQKNSKVLQISQ